MDNKKLTDVECLDINNDDVQVFPFSGIKVVGGIHVALGIISITLGIVNVIQFVSMNENIILTGNGQKRDQELATSFTISSTGIWCGIWFCLCGALALNIVHKNKASMYCVKTSFLILSVLCAAVFGPICFCVNGYESYLRHGLYTSDYTWLVPLVAAFFALMEIAMSVLSAVVCCCCSPLKQSKVRVLLTRNPSTKNHGHTNNVVTNPGNTTERETRSGNESGTRPKNPHLQKMYMSLFVSNKDPVRRGTEQAPKFNTCSTRRTRNFTSDHIHLNNLTSDWL